MTGVAARIEMTASAEARLDEYLAQVRDVLHGHPDVSPDEVAADVCEHIDTEFAALKRPVTLGELEAVLTRLGPPGQWAGASSQSPPPAVRVNWKQLFRDVRQRAQGVLNTLWKGPEDWRLPYLTFALTLLAPLTMGLSLIAAYFLARATVELAKEKGEPLGARRWLVYPAILAVGLPLLLALLFAPAMATAGIASEQLRVASRLEHKGWIDYGSKPVAAGERAGYESLLAFARQFPGTGDVGEVGFVIFTMVGTLAATWTLLGLGLWTFPQFSKAVFHPLLDGWETTHAVRFLAFAALVFVIWAGTAVRLWANVG